MNHNSENFITDDVPVHRAILFLSKIWIYWEIHINWWISRILHTIFIHKKDDPVDNWTYQPTGFINIKYFANMVFAEVFEKVMPQQIPCMQFLVDKILHGFHWTHNTAKWII